jgi:hypothetical protein
MRLSDALIESDAFLVGSDIWGALAVRLRTYPVGGLDTHRVGVPMGGLKIAITHPWVPISQPTCSYDLVVNQHYTSAFAAFYNLS